MNRLETLRQGKKTAEELNTEFLQIVGQAGMNRKTHLTIATLLGITGRRWSLDLATRSSSVMMS
jgi:hypothetical protein